MSFIQHMKEQFALKLIRRRLKKRPRKKEFHNLKTAKTAGILFDTTENENYFWANKLRKDLLNRGITVQLVAWLNKGKLPNYKIGSNVLFYTHRDATWAGKPRNKDLQKFTNETFDLLFVLSNSNHIAFRRMAILSQACCKLGATSAQNNDLDFMIEHKDSEPIESLIENIWTYLNTIKRK